MRNYIDALLGTYTFVTIQTDPPPPTITGRFVAEFFAETQEELDAIAAIYASFFVNVPNNIDCQIESQFTVVAFVQLDASNVMQLLQFIHASFPSTLGLLWEAINQPGNNSINKASFCSQWTRTKS
jgi:hypothetical protein